MFSPQQIQAALDHCFGLMTDPKKFYIILPYGIGDFLISGSFVYTLLKKFNRKTAALIMQERFRNLEISFDGVSETDYLSYNELMLIREFMLATKKHIGENYIYGHFLLDDQKNMIWNKELNFVDRYKKNVYDLPLDTPLHYPTVKDISDKAKRRLARDYELDKNRTVILMPYANSTRLMNYSFWQNIVAAFTQRGYRLYTNVGVNHLGGMEQPLPGTLPLNVSLNEIFYIAGQVKALIGLRSGIFDLLVFSKGNLICLLPRDLWFYDLKLNFPQTPSRVQSMYFEFNFLPQFNWFLSQFEIESMSVGNVKHKRIPTENLFFDEQNLFASVIRAVEAL